MQLCISYVSENMVWNMCTRKLSHAATLIFLKCSLGANSPNFIPVNVSGRTICDIIIAVCGWYMSSLI